MHAASGINDRAMTEFRKLIHEGVMERQVAGQMLKIYMDLGADGLSFEPLVAFGANTTDPHHGPDDTVVKSGDSVFSNVGYIKDGYCSDIIRTFYFQKANNGHRRIYEIVRSTNETAISKIRPGVPLYELDRAAGDLIAERGYGPFLAHRLGHFIGLGEHEFRDVSPVNTQKTEPEVIFSIEPGVYLPGDTSVRVKDLVLVTGEGCGALNHYPKKSEIID